MKQPYPEPKDKEKRPLGACPIQHSINKKEKGQVEKSLKLMKERYEAKCKECEELKRHCEILAYESFGKSELISETFGLENGEKSLKLMKERYEAKCKEYEELKRHCEILAYESFRKGELIYETFGLEDGEE